MIKKTTLLLVLTLVLSTALTTSCSLDSTCEFDDRFITTDFVAVESRIIFIEGFDQPQFSRYNGGSILYNEYAVTLLPIPETFSSDDPRQSVSVGITSANACTPIPPISEEPITNIVITSEQDFNSNYPAGTDLKPLFDTYVAYFAEGYFRQSLTDYLQVSPRVADQTTFFLNTPPSRNANFTFTIRYILDGQELDVYEYTTGTVEIIRPFQN